jgi:hypothetical protein
MTDDKESARQSRGRDAFSGHQESIDDRRRRLFPFNPASPPITKYPTFIPGSSHPIPTFEQWCKSTAINLQMIDLK